MSDWASGEGGGKLPSSPLFRLAAPHRRRASRTPRTSSTTTSMDGNGTSLPSNGPLTPAALSANKTAPRSVSHTTKVGVVVGAGTAAASAAANGLRVARGGSFSRENEPVNGMLQPTLAAPASPRGFAASPGSPSAWASGSPSASASGSASLGRRPPSRHRPRPMAWSYEATLPVSEPAAPAPPRQLSTSQLEVGRRPPPSPRRLLSSATSPSSSFSSSAAADPRQQMRFAVPVSLSSHHPFLHSPGAAAGASAAATSPALASTANARPQSVAARGTLGRPPARPRRGWEDAASSDDAVSIGSASSSYSTASSASASTSASTCSSCGSVRRTAAGQTTSESSMDSQHSDRARVRSVSQQNLMGSSSGGGARASVHAARAIGSAAAHDPLNFTFPMTTPNSGHSAQVVQLPPPPHTFNTPRPTSAAPPVPPPDSRSATLTKRTPASPMRRTPSLRGAGAGSAQATPIPAAAGESPSLAHATPIAGSGGHEPGADESDRPASASSTNPSLTRLPGGSRSAPRLPVRPRRSLADVGRPQTAAGVASGSPARGFERLRSMSPAVTSDVSQVSIFLATWNMNDRSCTDNIERLLVPETLTRAPDMYFVGLQEGLVQSDAWELKLQATLGPEYVLVHRHSLMAIQLTFFVHRRLVGFISSVESAHVATKLGGMVNTKGAVGISFKFANTTFVVINAHLAAHQKNVKDRNNDYHTIARSLALPHASRIKRELGLMPTPSRISKNKGDVTTAFDRVFWMGDLNYRVNSDRGIAETVIERSMYDILLAHDQLTHQRTKGRAFIDFNEAEINFPPTFKYDIDSDSFDTSQKQRVPSWTDRILYKTKEDNSITNELYNSVPSLRHSDHRPVFGLFTVRLDANKPMAGWDRLRARLPAAAKFDRGIYVQGGLQRVALVADGKLPEKTPADLGPDPDVTSTSGDSGDSRTPGKMRPKQRAGPSNNPIESNVCVIL